MKGFTLIELLAVIAILAIVMLISLPIISGIIEKSRTDSFLTSNKMILKALDSYLINNENLLPINVGETTEIPLQNLISNNHISSISSPFNSNNCTGYILITKTETDYAKNPHINCINLLNNSSENGLAAHFSFDNFAEPTDNYVATPLNSPFNWNGTVGLEPGMSFKGNPVAFNIASPTGGGMRYLATNGVLELLPLEKATTSIWVYRNSDVNTTPYFYMQGQTFDGTIWTNRDPISGYIQAQHSYFYEDGTVAPGYVTDRWVKQVTVITNNHSNLIRLNTNWYILSHSFTAGKMNYSMPQLEKKAYASEFAVGSRSASLRNYSMNPTTSNMSVATTPRWLLDSKRLGVYDFSRQVDVLPVNNALLNAFTNQKYSWGAWIKLDNSFSGNGRILMSQTNVLELSIAANRRITATTRDNIGYRGTPSSQPLDLNTWYHVFATCDGNVTKLYIDGKYVSEVSNSGFLNPSDNIYIGNWTSNQVFKGQIDDVKVYSRGLNEREVKLIYELSK